MPDQFVEQQHTEFPDDPVVAEETSEGLRAPDQAEMLAQVTHYVGKSLPKATPDDVCDLIDHGGADLVVDTDGRSVEEVAEAVLVALGEDV